MAGNARDVTIDILGRDKTAAATSSAARNFERLKDGQKSLGESFTKAGVAIASVTGALALANKVLSEGLTGGLVRANAQVALGTKGYAQLSAAAAATAHGLGLTTTEFLNSAGQAANLAKNLGFGQVTAVQFGTLLPDLAQRLAVMSSGSRTAAESSDMLRSALAGEFDPLQSVGINISALIVQQKALALQQQSGNKLTAQQATAMAVLAIVQDQTSQATEVLASKQGKAWQEAQKNTAAMKEQWQTLENQLTPALGKSLGFMAAMVDVFSSGENMHKLVTQDKEYIQKWRDEINGVKDAQIGATASVEDMAQGAAGAANDVYAYARSLEYARDAALKSSNATLTAREAARGYQDALDKAAEAISKHGTSLDIGTAKGRQNQAALDAVAQAANRQADAILHAGGTEAEYAASLAGSRAELEAMAVKFGMSRDAAASYAQAVLGIPRVVSTAVNLTTTVNGTTVSEGYFQRVLSAPKTGGMFAGGSTFFPLDLGDLGGGRTQPAAQVPKLDVTTNVLLDGRPFTAKVETAVEQAAWRARVGRR